MAVKKARLGTYFLFTINIPCYNLTLWFGLIVSWLKSHEPTARGPCRQRARGAQLLVCVKIYYNPHPYGLDSLWFGSIVAWINCGMDPLWLDHDSALNMVLLIRGYKFIGIHIVEEWQIVFN